MSRTFLALVGLVAVAACGGGDKGNTAAADSLSRDLQMPAADSSAALNDRPVDTTKAPPAETRAPAPKPSRPAASRPAPAPRPAPVAARSLAGGTSFAVATDAEITSATNKAGQTIQARVGRDVTDRSGKVVIPAGSVVTLEITAINASGNKSDTTGVLKLAARSVAIGGTSYPLDGSVGGLHTFLRGRKTNANDVAKVGAGAAAGAVVGRVLGGNTKGAVIGGILGGAVGAQRMVETKDRDVVLAAGSGVTVTLNGTFTR